MKSMNVISRCQAAFRSKKLDADIGACHHSLILAICRAPGRSQEELAKDICFNKSTVTRALAQLENLGYVARTPNPADKRQTLVEPTEKLLFVLPKVKAVTAEWNSRIADGISKEDMAVFNSVIAKMEQNARKIVSETEG
ncbi:MAG: MarR family transcriptional regulator [Oscillospiraceae bacterium]|nr:MarR family transcriptional regulator [Oscillospiraceae bacterium]